MLIKEQEGLFTYPGFIIELKTDGSRIAYLDTKTGIDLRNK